MATTTTTTEGAARVRSWPVVLGLMALTAAMRLYGLRGEAVWVDEIVSFSHLDASSLGEYLRLVRQDDPTLFPLYFTLQYYWSHLFGAGMGTIRLLSVFLALCTTPILYTLIQRFYGRLAAVTGTALFACAAAHIYYGQEIRMYALICLLAVVSAYTLFRSIETDWRGPWLAMHLAVNALLLATHLLATVFLFVEGLYLLLFYARSKRMWLTWGVAHGLLLIPWGYWLTRIEWADLGAASEWIPLPNKMHLWNILVMFCGGRFFSAAEIGPYMYTYMPADTAIAFFMTGLVLWFGLGAGGFRFMKRVQSKPQAVHVGSASKPTAFFALWAFVPVLVLFVISHIHRPCLVDRYVLHSSIALFVLVAAAIATFPSRRLAVLFACLLVGLEAYQSLAIRKPWRVDWPAVAELVAQNVQPTDRLVMLHGSMMVSFRYHAPELAKRTEIIESIDEAMLLARDRTQPTLLMWWGWDDYLKFDILLDNEGIPAMKARVGGYPPLFVYYINGKPQRAGPGGT